MGKEQELERRLKECREAKNKVFDRVGECMTLPDPVKAKLYVAVVPLIKGAIERCTAGDGNLDLVGLREVVFQKTMETLLGPDWMQLLEKL